MSIRTSEAQWDGTLKEGKGRFWTESGEIAGVFAFQTRFEEQPGTNPEELIGAAQASCFSMALAGDLERAGHQPQSVRTVASVHLEKGDVDFSITGIDLESEAQVPGIGDEEFQRIAEGTRVNCPVSKALAVPIGLRASLTS
ncbi:MAG: OsmC family peroxiredoxin [Gemmatimonadota bacterium]